MKVVFNDEFTYPIVLARETYIIGTGKIFSINFEHKENLLDELINLFMNTKILTVKILNDKDEELFITNKYTQLAQLYNNIINNENAGVVVDLKQRDDNL